MANKEKSGAYLAIIIALVILITAGVVYYLRLESDWSNKLKETDAKVQEMQKQVEAKNTPTAVGPYSLLSYVKFGTSDQIKSDQPGSALLRRDLQSCLDPRALFNGISAPKGNVAEMTKLFKQDKNGNYILATGDTLSDTEEVFLTMKYICPLKENEYIGFGLRSDSPNELQVARMTFKSGWGIDYGVTIPALIGQTEVKVTTIDGQIILVQAIKNNGFVAWFARGIFGKIDDSLEICRAPIDGNGLRTCDRYLDLPSDLR